MEIPCRLPMISAPMVQSPTNSNVWDKTLLINPHAVADKRSRVQQMFAAIAPSYDLNNHLHSLWMDQAWRRKAVKLAEAKGLELAELPLADLQRLEPGIAQDVYQVLTPLASVSSRTSFGGAAPERVRAEIARWKEILKCPAPPSSPLPPCR